jgi:hypothetical protein
MIPPRVLLANSCGIGRGHMVNLRIAAEALGPGFAYDAALARTGHADELSGPLGARVIRAPALGFGPHSQATPARGASASWGQYLADIGLCRDDLVRNQLRWWRQRIIDSDAAVLIADVAPLALLAARGLKAEGWQIETILAGTGYSAPPADLPAYPILLPDVTTLGHDETALLDRLNRILADEGIPGLATLPDILRSDTPFTTSLPLFDAYDGSRGDWPVLPPLERLPPQAGSGEEVFVYVSTAAGRNPAVLDLLADLPLPRGLLPGPPAAPDPARGSARSWSRPCRARRLAALRADQPADVPSSTGCKASASSLPSSTPHWSKELMPRITPSTKTRCS